MLKILFNGIFIIWIFSARENKVNSERTKICPELNSLLKNGEKVNVVVYFEGGVQPALDKASALRLNDRTKQNQAIVDALKDHADTSQSGVVHQLSARSSGNGFKYFKQYWNSNKVFIKEANADTVYAIAQDPHVLKIKKEVMGIIPDEITPITPEPDDVVTTRNVRDVPSEYTGWQLRKIQVDEAWEELGGNKGKGVVVATIDGGVRHTHEQFRDNFIGTQYGWYDGVAKSPEPIFSGGHGTHTLGLLVGKDTGVAPHATWMTCKGCEGGKCAGEALMDCIKFMACPTLPDGSNPDCSKAPHIVSNSWAVPRGSDDFDEDILRWRAMGIIPVFAIGNKGTICNQTMAPGENKFVIGVGNSDRKDNLDAGSAAGWASDGGIKPDLVAPGYFVLSAWYSADDGYDTHGGTSMACPTVAGVVALLKVRNMDLTFEEAYSFLTQNTDPAGLKYPSTHYRYYCNSTENPIDPRVLPNIFVGYGRVNAFKAVRAQSLALKNTQ